MILAAISGLSLWKPVQFQGPDHPLPGVPGRKARALPVHVGDRALSRRACDARAPGAAHACWRCSPDGSARRPTPHSNRRSEPMSRQLLSRSLFRPAQGVDQSVLAENKLLVRSLERRLFLAPGPQPRRAHPAHRLRHLEQGKRASGAQRLLALERPRAGVALRPDEARADLLGGRGDEAAALQRLLQHRRGEAGRRRDAGSSRSAGSSRTSGPGRSIASTRCPKVSQITRHVCVEGWDYIGKWSGVSLQAFPRNHRGRSLRQIRRFRMRRRLFGIDRHGERLASADATHDPLCR